jgi:signal transduction histidine kinase
MSSADRTHVESFFGRLSVRHRLTLTFTALFLAAGAVLLFINYELMSQLPFPRAALTGSGGPGVGTAISGIFTNETNQLVDAIRDATLHQLLVLSLVALGIMAVVSAVLGWYVSGRIVRPLHEMTETARRLSENNLHERFDLQGPDDELKDLASTFDAMLGRLDSAFESQKNFVSNASHELRTPLAITRAAIETQLARSKATPAQWRDMAERVLASTERSERLISSLLLLARVERGTHARQSVDLSEVVAETLDESRAEAARENLQVDARIEPGMLVSGDAQLLRRMVANLVDNAIRYNETEGFVLVSLKPAGEQVQLVVMNSSAPLTSEVLAEMFEPFRRGSDPRTRSARGSGLGLSIVRSIVVAHGGTIGAESLDGRGVQLKVELPRLGAERK